MKFKVTRLYLHFGSIISDGDLTLTNPAGQVTRIKGFINSNVVKVQITDHEGATHIIDKKTTDGLRWEMPGDTLTPSHSQLESVSLHGLCADKNCDCIKCEPPKPTRKSRAKVKP